MVVLFPFCGVFLRGVLNVQNILENFTMDTYTPPGVYHCCSLDSLYPGGWSCFVSSCSDSWRVTLRCEVTQGGFTFVPLSRTGPVRVPGRGEYVCTLNPREYVLPEGTLSLGAQPGWPGVVGRALGRGGRHVNAWLLASAHQPSPCTELG